MKKRLESGSFLLKPERQPKDFDFRQGTDLSEQESNLREKTAAESGWKQDVSNRPLRTSAKAVLSRSDLGGVPTERRF
ncbi:hypothetical protein [Desulfitobacterium sp. PCE1]|uniref:hypothetical protein n=1 Tax=Desulfitobacterium sp. PCE1 TaxID=146907 RepID=UPI000364F4B3|nr:hypothetical protein [Desulfitobacterium sp. PCE1]